MLYVFLLSLVICRLSSGTENGHKEASIEAKVKSELFHLMKDAVLEKKHHEGPKVESQILGLVKDAVIGHTEKHADVSKAEDTSEIFHSFDLDKNGVIDEYEFGTVWKHRGADVDGTCQADQDSGASTLRAYITAFGEWCYNNEYCSYFFKTVVETATT